MPITSFVCFCLAGRWCPRTGQTMHTDYSFDVRPDNAELIISTPVARVSCKMKNESGSTIHLHDFRLLDLLDVDVRLAKWAPTLLAARKGIEIRILQQDDDIEVDWSFNRAENKKDGGVLRLHRII